MILGGPGALMAQPVAPHDLPLGPSPLPFPPPDPGVIANILRHPGPNNAPDVAGDPYVTPTARIGQLRAAGVSQDALHQQALNYANGRLAVLQRLTGHVPHLGAALYNNSGDPLAAYAAASAAVTAAARHAGYLDPRHYITALLAQAAPNPYGGRH